jgi:hypothetical protein
MFFTAVFPGLFNGGAVQKKYTQLFRETLPVFNKNTE